MAKLDNQELVEDRKSCKKIGPCGVGKKVPCGKIFRKCTDGFGQIFMTDLS